MKPLKIVFRLGAPVVVPEYPIHLDALIARMAVERAAFDLSAQEALPLARHETGNGWVWKASWVEFSGITQRWLSESIRRYDAWGRARDHARGVLDRFKKLNPGTGPDKAYQFFTPMMAASEAHAYCVGDIQAVSELLQNLKYLGKLHRLGYGRITAVEILEDERAMEFWRYRTMPESVPGYVLVWSCLRPPYWERRNCTESWQPVEAPPGFCEC
jgi:CRISPR type IV-associated protein Csf3